jgi:hypothetical protein
MTDAPERPSPDDCIRAARLGLRVRRVRNLARRASGVAALLLAACAGHQVPDNPDARTCLPPENPAMRSRDYNMRLAGYTQRADAFAKCMTDHGYALDENELEKRLLHFEQVKNANVMGGDPGWAMRIEEQELRVNPTLWHMQ